MEKNIFVCRSKRRLQKVFFYYYPLTNSEPVYSLDIPDKFKLNEDAYEELENELYKCFKDLWQEFKAQEQEQWTNLTYILDNTGHMKINYGYEDIPQINPIEKQEKWEAEYLK